MATGNSVRVFNLTDSGNVAPQRALSGATTGLNGPTQMALFGTQFLTANSGNSSVTLHNLTDNGDIAPQRTISGAATGLSTPAGIVLGAE